MTSQSSSVTSSFAILSNLTSIQGFERITKYQVTSFMVGVKYEEFHLRYLHLSSGRIRGMGRVLLPSILSMDVVTRGVLG
jgi:hypothetical protein